VGSVDSKQFGRELKTYLFVRHSKRNHALLIDIYLLIYFTYRHTDGLTAFDQLSAHLAELIVTSCLCVSSISVPGGGLSLQRQCITLHCSNDGFRRLMKAQLFMVYVMHTA